MQKELQEYLDRRTTPSHGSRKKLHKKATGVTLKKKKKKKLEHRGKKVASPRRDAVKTWLSECTSFSNANVPEAAILFIVAQHNMGHLPVSVSVIPSPCFINLLLYGLRE